MEQYRLDFVKAMLSADRTPISNLIDRDSLSSEAVENHFHLKRNGEKGIYVFWWEDRVDAKTLDPIYHLSLVGPQIRRKKNTVTAQKAKHPIYQIQWDKSDFPEECASIFPLYIGKTTVFKKRISQHLALGSKDGWLQRGDEAANRKQHSRKLLIKHTTACQFRSGFEHICGYKDHATTMDLMKQVSISFFPINTEDKSNRWDIKARFYLEDLAIGYYRPWFNVDSER